MSARYLVAFPHPSVEPILRVKACRLGPEDDISTIREQLQEAHPDHSSDLKSADFYRVSPSPTPQLLPSSPFQTQNLPYQAVIDDSSREMYEWIKGRGEHLRLLPFLTMESLFPGRIRQPEHIDIVAVTEESECLPAPLPSSNWTNGLLPSHRTCGFTGGPGCQTGAEPPEAHERLVSS